MFDELMIFNLKNLDKETFADGLIRIACYDSNIMPLAGNIHNVYVCIGFIDAVKMESELTGLEFCAPLMQMFQ